MVVPYRYLKDSINLASSSSVSTMEKTRKKQIKSITRGLIFHSTALFVLFLFNWYEHMTGYTGPPSIRTFGLVSSNMLAALLYNLWWTKTKREINKDSIQDQTTDESFPLLPSSSRLVAPFPKTITFSMMALSIMYLIVGFVLDAQWEKVIVEDFMDPFISIIVISTMGRLSYMYNKNHDYYPHSKQQQQESHDKKNKNSKEVKSSAFHSWKMACISFCIMAPGIELESSLCHYFNNDGDVRQIAISRFYHSIFLHFIIPLMFFFVTKCTFQLVEMELKLSSTIRNYESKKVSKTEMCSSASNHEES